MSFKYKFTLICAVYNVEEYIEETLQSFIDQDIGFKENVQVVLVNDGSKDKSGEICDRYGEMYPNNIIVIHKENGGVSSARNEGLRHIEGKYYNFCDPDDLLSPNTLSSVWKFFEKYEEETDMVTIPMHFFEACTGVPYHNCKFDRGTRLINLRKEPYAPLFSSSSSFIHSRMKDMFTFDTRLSFSEDAKYVQQILMEKQTLGVVADCKYMYRRRISNTSAINTSQNNDSWYFDTLKYNFLEIIEEAKKRFGNPPKFIQHTFLCDFKWRLTQKPEENKYIKTDPEMYRAYYQLLSKCLREIEPDVVMSNKFYDDMLKLHILRDIQKRPLVMKKIGGVDYYFYRNQKFFDISKLSEVELAILEPGKDSVDIYFNSVSLPENANNSYIIDVNGKSIEPVELKREEFCNLHVVTKIIKYFKATIPLDSKEIYFSVKLKNKNKGGLSTLQTARFGKFFPINTVRSSYCTFGKYIMKKASENVFVIKKASFLRKCFYEFRYCKDLLKVKNPKGIKMVGVRMLYFVNKAFFRKKRWLLMDRINKADDNAEALYDYISKNKPRRTKAHFAIAKGPEFDRLTANYKNIVEYNTRDFYIKYLLSDILISSHVDEFIMRPLGWKQVYLKDIAYRKKFVFLQHGVTQNDIAGYLNKFSKNLTAVTVTSEAEADIFRGKKFCYDESNIWMTGFARFDRLYDKNERVITIMPTWRSYLASSMNNETGVWNLVQNFTESSFFLFYNRLLNDERLIEKAKENGYKIRFMPHPILAPYKDLFDKNDFVEFNDANTSYRDIYAESALVLTDYSSAVYDFAYLKKPVVYAQFDVEEMKRRSVTYNLNTDFYEKHAFGPICHDYESTVDCLIAFMENGCKLPRRSRKNRTEFFAHKDKHNCARIIEKIKSL